MVTMMLVRLLIVCLEVPNVWSNGSCVIDDLSGVAVAGAGVFSDQSGMAWNERSRGHLDDVQIDDDLGGDGCRLFCSVPGPLQSVQRAEL